ncbi:MAG: hypothetical protein HY885_16350 [Deltaproteobacteria bacterium]|nr:hypothetical protein [Deltaproteobacteria bacterium]
MKRSRRICLTLLASLSLAACDSEEPTQRAMYLSQQECIDDWGSVDECEDDDHDGHWHGPHYYYHGGKPHYYSKKSGSAMAVPGSALFSRVSAGSTSPRAASTISSSISRGGFGSSSSSHSASS